MNDPSLEKNSRTIRQARHGQIENLTAIVAVMVSLVAPFAGMHWIVQCAGAGMAALILVMTIPRWSRVRRYRREDHESGRNRKRLDSYPTQAMKRPDGWKM